MNLYQKFEDSNLTIAQCKQGYYQVGDKLFNMKFNALLESSRTKLKVNWNFNYDIFKDQSVKPRMNVSLRQLYKDRAEQIRDQYDYVILAFSGGSDSDNILKTFVNNNIKLDEIWCDWSHELIKKSGYILNRSKDASNMPSEWYYAIKPELDKIKITNPEIKIHLSDSTSSLHDEDKADSLSFISGLATLSAIKKYRYIKDYVATISKNKRVGVILGVDKLIPVTTGNEYGFIFSDNSVQPKGNGLDNELVLEYFYWTGDYPYIVTEQCHNVWDYLNKNLDFMKTRMDLIKSGNWTDRDKVFDNIIKKICYPDWDFNKHQVNKTTSINSKFFSYVHNFKEERFYQSSFSFLHSHINMLDSELTLDPHYKVKKEVRPFYNYHPLGKLPDINL